MKRKEAKTKRGMSLNFADSLSTAHHKHLLVSSVQYCIRNTCVKNEEDTTSDNYVLYDGFIIGTMLSAGQVCIHHDVHILYYTEAPRGSLLPCSIK